MRRKEREASFTEFVTTRRTHLRRIAYAICGDWAAADDLVQTALVKLYVAWPRMVHDGREEAYVRTILVRANVDEHRRPARREHPGLEGFDAADRRTDDTEERSALFDALQQLPVMQRKAVFMRHWLDLSVEQTARELGITEGTVKSHTSRGLGALQLALTMEES